MKKTFKILLIIFISLIFSIKNVHAEELPKIYFEGDINNILTKEDERKIKLTYTSENLTFKAYALIKIQGSSSLTYEKKNYTIKLYEDAEYTSKKKIDLGFGKESKYCLKANWIDMTHSRNIVTARITSSIQKKYNLFTDTPNNGLVDGFPIEVYINNEFLGLYTLNIPKDEWAFNMDKNNPNHIVVAGISYTDATEFNDYATFSEWDIEVGPKTNETLEKLNRVIGFVMNSTDEEFKQNFENYFNLDASLNYYVMLNTAELIDNTTQNLLLVTYDGKIWYPSLYDLDTSWGTNWNGTITLDYNLNISQHASKNLLWTKFERNFKNEIANRYFELRKDILTKENILNEFYNFINSIPATSKELEQNRWTNIPGYGIEQIENFLDVRLPHIDDYMYNLYDITPSLTLEYSTTKNAILPVKVTISPNRNDITLLKDGLSQDDYTYTFKENGEYTINYQDANGFIYTTTIKIDWIITDKFFKIFIPTIIIIGISIIFLILSHKEKLKNNQPKEPPITPNITTEKKANTTTQPKKATTKQKTKTNTNKKKQPKRKNK